MTSRIDIPRWLFIALIIYALCSMPTIAWLVGFWHGATK